MEHFPSRPALYIDKQRFTYEALGEMAGHIASTLSHNDHPSTPLVALLAHRSLTAYAGVLGIIGAGKGFVALNPKLPTARLLQILTQSNTRLLVVGKEALKVLGDLLPKIPIDLTIFCPDLDERDVHLLGFGAHRIIGSRGMARGTLLDANPCTDSNPIAYLLFTSGSTGKSKGVPVRHRNVVPYVRYICDQYGVDENDRFSQMFDLSFDLSVHDMFVCWERGASLHVVPDAALMAPGKFIRDHQLTMWFSVPSVIAAMSKLGMLRAGSFPSLRGSLFCGEPLHRHYAEAWQKAAPNSFVENLYGPTETTIAISRYRWDSEKSPHACEHDIVPIGLLFDGQRSCIVDANLHKIEAGARGELCLSGSQVTEGYWDDPDKTERQFVTLSGQGATRWYRTGDLVRQDEGRCLHYISRIDDQVKIRGHRVELHEVESVLRRTAGCEQVASVAWPIHHGLAQGVVAFIVGVPRVEVAQILGGCRELLPDYMVPRQLYFIKDLPLNVHGKTDRRKLVQMLEEGVDENCP